MSLTFFILNGPKAGDQIPLTNAPVIRQYLAPGRWIDYEPAPPAYCSALGPCVMLLGTQISRSPLGNLVLAHPRWVRTLLDPIKPDIAEIETDMPGAGIARQVVQ